MTARELADAGLTADDIEAKVVYLIATWLSGFLYGVYLCLFIAAFPILVRNNALKNFATAVFFMGNMVIFVLASINCSVNVFDTVIAFAYQKGLYAPVRPFNGTSYWYGAIPSALTVIIVMVGDMLMIYRCFLIWQRRYCAIIPSLLLAVLSCGCHIATVWFAHNTSFNGFRVRNWPLIALAPLFYLLQTSLTTSLIAWKIWSQSRRSTAVGLTSFHVPALLSILRIIAESAAIYTAVMLAMVVLLALDHPARATVHSCITPITGIVFVMMALRIHAVREESGHMPASASLMPSWLVEEPRVTRPGADIAEGGEHPVANPRTIAHTSPRS